MTATATNGLVTDAMWKTVESVTGRSEPIAIRPYPRAKSTLSFRTMPIASPTKCSLAKNTRATESASRASAGATAALDLDGPQAATMNNVFTASRRMEASRE
jgi:hypothetical protein